METPKLDASDIISMHCAIPDCDNDWDWMLKAKTESVLVPFCEDHFKNYWENKLPEVDKPIEVVRYE
jgi:hypothetical protein